MGNQALQKKRLFSTLYYVILLISTVIILIPIIFIIISSFKTETQIFSSPWSLPASLDFSTYYEIFVHYNMVNYFSNSIFYSIVSCFICLVLTFPASYAICRMRWRASKYVMAFLVSGLMIPVHAIIVPLYITVSKAQLPHNFALIFIYAAATIPTALFLFVGNLKSIPVSIEEAAVIDGCSIPRLLMSIIYPLSRSVMASVIVFTFLSVWNDLLIALIFLSNERDKTIPVGIMRFIDSYFTNYGFLLSALVVTIIPTIILFAFLSKYIVKGLTAGAVKE